MWKKILIKAVVLILLFSGTVLIVDKINNRGYTNVAAETDAPVLPVIYLQYADNIINRLVGYTQDMDTSLMRENIIPVDYDRQITILAYDDYGYAERYDYELRSQEGDVLIEEGSAEFSGESGGYDRYNITLRMNLEEGTEYVLVILAQNDDEETVRYYTRIVVLEKHHLTEALALAGEFNEETFIVNEEKNNEEAYDEAYDEKPDNIITTYVNDDVETDGNISDLSQVNFDSDYDLITWGNLDVDRISEVIPGVREVDGQYTLIEMKYLVSSVGEEGVLNYYISEYYNIYYNEAEGRAVIKDFDRNMQSEFRYDNINASDNSIVMGINSADNIKYLATEDCRKAAFTMRGELWLYDYRETTMTNVYGAWNDNIINVREIENKNDINIISMDDDGNVIFAVYGYITRGIHEGKNGILLVEYNHENSENQELAFIECAGNYEILKKQAGEFTYYGQETKNFYFTLNSSIYVYNTDSGELSAEAENIPRGYLLVSDNMKVAAYPDSDDIANVKKIILHNFATGEISELTSQTGVLYPAGFIGTDFIYGEAAAGGIRAGTDGSPEISLSSLFIVDENGDNIKDYSRPNVVITDIVIQDDIIYMDRAVSADGTETETEPDYISYRQEDGAAGIYIQSYYDETEYNKLVLKFPSNIYVQNVPREIITKFRVEEKKETVYIDLESDSRMCYFFSNYGYGNEYLSVGEAIMEAQNKGGIVVDYEGSVVFRHGEAASYNTVAGSFSYYSCEDDSESLGACEFMSLLSAGCEAIYNDVISAETWEAAFAMYDGVRGLNISGADLDTALVYLSDGIPFTTLIDGRYVLVVSYNSTHIRYYDPVTAEEVRTSRNGFEKRMEAAGNVIYTYILK